MLAQYLGGSPVNHIESSDHMSTNLKGVTFVEGHPFMDYIRAMRDFIVYRSVGICILSELSNVCCHGK